MAARDMGAWKIFRLSRLLKLTLTVIVFTGLCLFSMVHQIENPFTKELPLPMSCRPGDDVRQFSEYVQEMKERQDTSDTLQNNDALVRDLLNFHTNLSLQNTSTSREQPQSQRKSRLNSARQFLKRVSNETGIKLSRLGVLNVNISHRGLPNYSRGFSDDNRQLPEIQSDSQRRSDTTKSSRTEQTPSKSETGANVELRSKLNESKLNLQPESFESKSESQQQNFERNLHSPAKKTENSYLSTDLTSNHDDLQGKPVVYQVKPTSLSSYAVNNVKSPVIKTRSLESQATELNRYNESKSHLKQQSNKVDLSYQRKLERKITNGHRDSDQLRKVTSESFKSHPRKQNSSEVISNYRSDIDSKIRDGLQDSNKVPKASSRKVKTYLKPHSSEVVSRHQDKPELTITRNLRNSHQTPRAASEKMISSRKQYSSRKGPATKLTNHIRDLNQPSQGSWEKRKSLLIFGDDRSGTTFVTKMFAADPQMFTVYEPLWVTKKWFQQMGPLELEYQERIVVDVVNALLSCQFTQSQAAKSFLAHTRTSWVGNGVFERNVFRTLPFTNRTQSGKLFYPKLSSHPKFAEDVCLNKFNHSVVKVGQVRVPRESISMFIPRVFRENPDTEIRVIQIVRDPRGSINSRIRNGWISDFTYKGFPESVNKICRKITANIKFGRVLQHHEWLKERYMEITYREIATMPITTAKKIYRFAGFELPDSLIDWIVSSTNPDEVQLEQAIENPFSHIRDSSNNYLKWRKESPIKRVRVIEQHCKELLNLLGLDAVAEALETLRS